MVLPVWMMSGPAPSQAGPPVASAPRRGRMLVLESDEALREVILEALGPALPLAGACNGREALAELAAGKVSSALISLQVPDLGALALLRRVREYLPGSKVVVLSDSGNEDLVRQVAELGVVDFLEKPFSLAELYESVDSVLRGVTRPLDLATFQVRSSHKCRMRRQAMLAFA
jgi:DNA-binding response OmpR family regulator